MKHVTTLLKAGLSAALCALLVTGTGLAQQRIEVPAAYDTLRGVVHNMAAPGDTIVLITDGGNYENEDEIRNNGLPLVIMAAPGLSERPVISNTGPDGTKDIIRLYDDLTLIGLEFDGKDPDQQTKYGIRTGSGSGDADTNVKKGYVLKIIDCYFHDFVHGSDGNAFRAYSMTDADSIIIQNSIIENTGKEAVRVRDEDSDRPGFGFYNVDYFEVTNSTFWKIRNDAISVYGGDEDPNTPGPKVIIDHVTIYQAGHYVLNLKDVEDATVTNTILVDNYDIVNATNKTLGLPWMVPGSRIAYSDTLNLSDDGDWTGNRGDPTIENLLAVDPMFADPDMGDFTLLPGSPVIGAGMNGMTMGDPRWWPAITSVAAGQNTLMDAVNNAMPNEVILLTDGGGEYLNDNNINVTMPLTIMAAPGVMTRPVIKNNEPNESTRVIFDIFDSLHLDNVEIDGQAGTEFNAKYLLRIRNSSSTMVDTTMVLKVTNSYLHGVIAGSDGNFLRQYSETYADSVIFQNSILDNSGKEGIRIKDESSDRPNQGFYNVGYFELSNTTISRTKRSAIYVYAGDDDPNTPEPEFMVDHLTCYMCGYDNGRAVWPRDIQNATVTNSIFASSKEDGDFSVRLYGNSSISYSDTFMVSPVVLSGSATESDNYDVDPEFADPDNGDFTIPQGSMLRTAGSNMMGIGDLRWIHGVTDVEPLELPQELDGMLGQNYPNPFVSTTTIPYRVPESGYMRLELFDLLGRRVLILEEGDRAKGDYSVSFSMPDMAATGVYFYRLTVGGQTEWRSLMRTR